MILKVQNNLAIDEWIQLCNIDQMNQREDDKAEKGKWKRCSIQMHDYVAWLVA